MSRTLSVIAVALLAIVASSCCCTSDVKPPKLKKLPKFMEFPDAPPEVEVDLESSK